jgi:hypothetical protein
MSGRLGPMEIGCDAPPYPVVRACEGLGFQSPLDVRWCRLSRARNGRLEPGGGLGLHLWEWLFGTGLPREATCACGQPLPALDKYTFTFASDKVADYRLGQCRRCRAMFWEEG